MYSYSRTQRMKNLKIFLVVAVVLAGLITGFVLILRMEPRIIDAGETAGEPADPAAITGYVAYETPDVCKVKICCEPAFADGYLSLWLTSPADNDVLIRAELYSVKVVYDEESGQGSFLPDKLLGKTGFIHPGTYVEKVKVRGVRAGVETKIMVKISTMYEDTQMSKGIFYIRTTVRAQTTRQGRAPERVALFRLPAGMPKESLPSPRRKRFA